MVSQLQLLVVEFCGHGGPHAALHASVLYYYIGYIEVVSVGDHLHLILTKLASDKLILSLPVLGSYYLDKIMGN